MMILQRYDRKFTIFKVFIIINFDNLLKIVIGNRLFLKSDKGF